MNKRSHIFKRFFALFTIAAVLLTALPGHMKAAGYFHDVFDIEVTVRQESYGLLDAVKSGEIAGKTETGKRLLSLKIDVTRFGRSFENCMSYCTYSDRSGWSGWVSAGGTAGENKSGDYISGVRIDLTGVFGELYDVYYRSYVSGIGWLSWAKNGEDSGVLFGDVGIEAVHVILCKKQVAYAPVMGGCTAISEATLDMLHCEDYSFAGRNGHGRWHIQGWRNRTGKERRGPRQSLGGEVPFDLFGKAFAKVRDVFRGYLLPRLL